MKNNDLVLNSKQTERLFFTLYVLFIVAMLLLINGCTPAKISHGPGTPAQWEEFNACIEAHPSDMVCDSCYYVIYGIH